MAVTDLVNWSTGEVVGCWVKEDLVVGSLQSDWSPFYYDWDKEEGDNRSSNLELTTGRAHRRHLAT